MLNEFPAYFLAVSFENQRKQPAREARRRILEVFPLRKQWFPLKSKENSRRAKRAGEILGCFLCEINDFL